MTGTPIDALNEKMGEDGLNGRRAVLIKEQLADFVDFGVQKLLERFSLTRISAQVGFATSFDACTRYRRTHVAKFSVRSVRAVSTAVFIDTTKPVTNNRE